MRIYELVLVVKPSVAETARKKLLDSVESWLKTIKITQKNEWGQKVLAYPIKREQSGYFVDMMLETQNSIPSDFEKRLLTNDNVLRHLLIRKK